MFCVVPLAGPDFVHPKLGARPLISINGKPLIQATVAARPWFRSGDLSTTRLIYIFRQTEATEYARSQLQNLFPGSQSVTLSHPTAGALHTVLAGCALIYDVVAPVVVDLADIMFDSSLDVEQMFTNNPDLGAIVPCFPSNLSCYSYLQVENDRVLRAREKQVISSTASAGVYIFRNLSTLLAAVAWSASHYSDVCHGNAAFVCPSINGLIQAGQQVAACEVTNVISISKEFH